ncbi:MAG: LysR family transcriptional regulator [Albidovulum sp.]
MDVAGFDRLPLEWIRAFETAARCGSFTAAASETGLTQSAISQRIANLERRLGTPLFVRKARQIGLTPQGEAWLPHVQAALESLRDSSEALFGVSQRQLTLSASASITELWLVPRLARLAEATGAQVTIRTMVISTDAAAEDGTLKIRYGAGDWSAAFRTPLYDEQIAPVVAPALQAQAEDWRDLPRLAVSGPRPGWAEWSARTATATTPVAGLRFDTFAAGLAAARAGLGVLLASLPLIAPDLATGALCRVSPEVLPHHETYWLLAAKERMSRRQWDQICACLTDGDGSSAG